MSKGARRIVTGHDADGKAVVIFDGDAPNTFEPPGLFDGFGETDHPHFDFDGSGVRFTIEPRENENGSNKQTPPA